MNSEIQYIIRNRHEDNIFSKTYSTFCGENQPFSPYLNNEFYLNVSINKLLKCIKNDYTSILDYYNFICKIEKTKYYDLEQIWGFSFEYLQSELENILKYLSIKNEFEIELNKINLNKTTKKKSKI